MIQHFKKAQFILCPLMILFLHLPLNGQNRYCTSHSDYLKGNWTIIENPISFKNIGKGKSDTSKSNIRKLIVDDKNLKKTLKKQARFIIFQDTLFVNCNGLTHEEVKFKDYYAIGFRYGIDNICFVASQTDAESAIRNPTAGVVFGGLIGGAIGGAISGALGSDTPLKILKDQKCYIIYSDSKNVRQFKEREMKGLLHSYPEMEEEYYKLEDKEKESAATIVPILHKMGLLNKY